MKVYTEHEQERINAWSKVLNHFKFSVIDFVQVDGIWQLPVVHQIENNS